MRIVDDGFHLWRKYRQIIQRPLDAYEGTFAQDWATHHFERDNRSATSSASSCTDEIIGFSSFDFMKLVVWYHLTAYVSWPTSKAATDDYRQDAAR